LFSSLHPLNVVRDSLTLGPWRARHVARLAFCLALAIPGLLAATPEAREADPVRRAQRVRAYDDRIAELIRVGYAYSATFRDLIDALEQTDVIVYLVPAVHLPKELHGHLRFCGVAGQHRYLRISVKLRAAPDNVVALIAHELRHALEVAAAPEVVDEASFEALYEAIGYKNCYGYETAAARHTERIVLNELRRRPAQAIGGGS
jgi:hypothetical protein